MTRFAIFAQSCRLGAVHALVRNQLCGMHYLMSCVTQRMLWEDCFKRDLERLGGEWKTTAKDRSWRLLTENAVRAKWVEERKAEGKMTVTMANLTPDDRANKRRTTEYMTKFKAHLKTYYFKLFLMCSCSAPFPFYIFIYNS